MTGPTMPSDLHRDPALDADDLLTADQVRRGMRHVVMTTPVPTTVAMTAPAAGPDRRWRFASPAGLAAAAATVVAGVGAVAVVTNLATPSAAWSATPSGVSAGDREKAREACKPPVVDNDPDRKGEPAPPPETMVLPPLAVLDLRGNGAAAVFADKSMTADCVLARKDGRWERLALSFSPVNTTGAGTALSLDGYGETTQPDGTAVTYLNGFVGADVSSVRLTIPGQDVITASVAAGRFAVWLPSTMNGPGARVSGTDANGKEVGSVDVDAALAKEKAAVPKEQAPDAEGKASDAKEKDGKPTPEPVKKPTK